MKKLLSAILFALVFMAIGFCICFYCLPPHLYNQGWSDGYAYIKPIEDLQRQVGAVPDGIIGPNTIAKYEKALNNQYAEQTTCSNVREFDRKMLARIEK